MSEQGERFVGIARLYGETGLRRLAAAHVCVVGIGGVGSWAVEALARSGVGALTLVDLDDICVSNVNRQIHALDPTVGRPKVEVMAARVRAINPDCRVTACIEFFTESTADGILGTRFDCIVDAIDSVSNKVLLIVRSQVRELPVVVCGAAGGRCDPTQVRVADLAEVTHDRLLAEVRKRLRRDHGLGTAPKRMGVECIFSPEPPRTPAAPAKDCADSAGELGGPFGEPRQLNCDWGLGSATFVTGTFGFVAAARAIQRICRER